MEYKTTKPLRLIELFGGYGSQHFALDYLNFEFEQWKLCEWAVKSIQAYKDAHCKEDTTDYSKDLTKEEVMEYLAYKGISSNYNEPMTPAQVKRLGEKRARIIYNNIMATNNLVNIQQVKGSDLEIVDTDEYSYLMTYSFPCQSLSVAGKQEGMEKGGGTRSGLLWEVERILNECEELPQMLLMENVTQVHGKKNKANFDKWCDFLSSKGYSNYWEDLNAKNFGVPQNRNRTFMVSILGDTYFEFPKEIELKTRLKDVLEETVDEKYYVSEERVQALIHTVKANQKGTYPMGENTQISYALGSREHRTNGWKTECPTLCARDYKDPKVVFVPNNINPIRLGGMFDDEKGKHQAGSVWDKEGLSPTLDTMQDGYRQPCIAVCEATKKGYAIAEEGDSINISQPNSKTRRGRVGKQIANTLLTSAEQCVLEPQACAIRGRNPENPKSRESGLPTKQMLEVNKNPGIANCLTTVQKDSMIVEPNTAIDQKHIDNMPNNQTFAKKKSQEIELTPFYIFDLCSIIDQRGGKYENDNNTKALLQILWKEACKEEIQQEIRRFSNISKKKILRSNVYEKKLFKDRGQLQPNLLQCTHNSTKDKQPNIKKNNVRNLWEEWKIRYTPQRWELSEQQFKQLNLFMQELSHQTPQEKRELYNLWKTCKRFGILRETLSALQKIWGSTLYKEQEKGYRIRKLVPLECFRLMGVRDKDFENIAENQSNSSLYHLAGDSIVIDVLIAILKELLINSVNKEKPTQVSFFDNI